MYSGVQRCTEVYSGVQRCTAVYRGLQRCTAVYRGVQRCTAVYSMGSHWFWQHGAVQGWLYSCTVVSVQSCAVAAHLYSNGCTAVQLYAAQLYAVERCLHRCVPRLSAARRCFPQGAQRCRRSEAVGAGLQGGSEE